MGSFFSSFTICTVEHRPRVASKSVCSFSIFYSVMMKALGLIWGGRFTLEAIDLNMPAILFTFWNWLSIYLKYSWHPSYLSYRAVG